jgi:hypothetical protein
MHAKDPLPVAGRTLSQPVQRDPKSYPRSLLRSRMPTRTSRLQRLLWMFTSGQ